MQLKDLFSRFGKSPAKGDPAAQIAAQITELTTWRSEANRRSADLAKYVSDAEAALDHTAADSAEFDLRHLHREIEQCDRRIADLRAALAAAQETDQREAVDWLLDETRSVFARLTAAAEALVAANEDAIALQDDAAYKLGAGKANSLIPNVRYPGYATRDALEVWKAFCVDALTASTATALRAKQPRPAPAPPPVGETAVVAWIDPPAGMRAGQEQSLPLEEAIDLVAKGAATSGSGGERLPRGAFINVRFLRPWLDTRGKVVAAVGEVKLLQLATAMSLLNLQIAERNNPSKPLPMPLKVAAEAPPRRRDRSPGDRERIVEIKRSGVDLDGIQLKRGDHVIVDELTARSLAENGAAVFVPEPGPADESIARKDAAQ